MKPFLVDVPVRVNIWIRPECQRKQFEVLKQARPSIIFLQSDGGRNEKEWEAIRKNREIFETEVDWDCKIYKIYEETNQGLYTMGRKVREFIWQHVDRCIFLEDDILPSVSFFQYCAELLEHYKDDERISCICGMNHLGVYEDATSDYFFSRQGSIWGIARWRRTEKYRGDFEYGKDPYVMKLLKERTKGNKAFRNRYKAYAKQKYYEGHVAGGEFFIEFSIYGQNQLQIIPKRNLINNMGCDNSSEHFEELKLLPRGIRRVFGMKTYELDMPLKHNNYVIPDEKYEKKRNRIMAYNCPMISFFRLLERFFLYIRYGKLSTALKKIKRKLSKGNKKVEK